MRKSLIRAAIPACAFAALSVSCARTPKADYPVKPVPFTDVRLNDVFWAPRLETNRAVTIPHNLKQNETTGRNRNFELAAAALGGAKDGKFATHYPFDDSDVYKVIEAAAYALAIRRDPAVEAEVDAVIAKIGAAQEPDGYLYTARTIPGPPPVDWLGKDRWSNLYMSHELYNPGHLYEAAVAYHQATGKKALLQIAVKNADLIARTFGPGKRTDPPGHEEIEIGLVKLYRETGKKKYLDLAKFFVDARGKAEGRKLYGEYSQDHKPLVEQAEAVGHAVRAGYLYTGAADVAALTGDAAIRGALDRIWEDVVGRKIYLTGGIGAVGGWEGYGPAYRLPNASAYAETCAAIATFLWNSRMFLLEADAKYVDVMERILYNGVLSGISLGGDLFFYPNPLASFGQHARTAWFQCACCPPNVARILASVPGYVYAASGDKLFVNLYAQGAAKVRMGAAVLELVQTTEYPWQGNVRIEVKPAGPAAFTLMVRIPGWALNKPLPSDLYVYPEPAPPGTVVRVNGEAVSPAAEKGYLPIARTWTAGDAVEIAFPMPARRVLAHETIEADRGRVAVERGPLVYCAEFPDNGGRVTDVVLPDGAELKAEFRKDLLSGVVVVTAAAESVSEKGGRRASAEKPLTLIPYFAWANRGAGEMAVWLARDPAKARPLREPGLEAQADVTASEGAVRPRRVNDQYDPEASDDATGYMHWWPKKSSLEWIEYAFPAPVRVSETSVYWYDDTGGGECRIPESWRVFYKSGDTWVPVKTADAYGLAKNTANAVKFTPVRTSGLRLEVQLPQGFTAGVHEWKAK